MKLCPKCNSRGVKTKLVSETERVTGLCFHCGDGEYHGDDETAPRRSDKWNAYIGAPL